MTAHAQIAALDHATPAARRLSLAAQVLGYPAIRSHADEQSAKHHTRLLA
jgi:hypothetical protein